MNGSDKLSLRSMQRRCPRSAIATAFPSQYFQMMDATDGIFHVMVSAHHV